MMVGTYNNNCNGVYGNTPADCYASGSYEHYQYHHHHYYQDQMYPHSEYCGSSNRLENLPKQYNGGYYDSMLGYDYSSSTDDSRRSEEAHYYGVQHQHYPQDDLNIITSPNGLSYTNLDYSNTDYSYQQKSSTPPKEYVSYEALESKRDADRPDECHETLEYLHPGAMPEEQYGSSYGPSVKEESQHFHANSSSSLNPLEYHQTAVPLHHMHQSHHQPHGGSTATGQSNVPTYKWMQVKRNVPKPGNF